MGNFYAVRVGRFRGIFETWDKCKESVDGFPSAEYKKFGNREAAEAYLNNISETANTSIIDDSSIFLAGSSGTLNENSYYAGAFYCTKITDQGQIKHFRRNNSDYASQLGQAGEVFAAIEAFKWAIAEGLERIKLFYRYDGIEKWFTGEWSTGSKLAQHYVGITSDYRELIEVDFFKYAPNDYPEVHSNLQNALGRRFGKIKRGNTFFSIPYFSDADFKAFIELLIEEDERILQEYQEREDRKIYTLTLNNERSSVILYKTGKKRLLVQSRNHRLFSVITSIISQLESTDAKLVDNLLESAYHIHIRSSEVDEEAQPFLDAIPSSHPDSLKKLVRQSVINMKYMVESDDYTHYVFPALRALEGHIKELLRNSGIEIGSRFDCFNRDSPSDPYVLSRTTTTDRYKQSIEICYNYYKNNRDSFFHFGDILSENNDDTRLISDREEARQVIEKTLKMIIIYQ
ncbi:ribonuclease H1 domain-containing protein [Rothia sp. 11273D007AR]